MNSVRFKYQNRGGGDTGRRKPPAYENEDEVDPETLLENDNAERNLLEDT